MLLQKGFIFAFISSALCPVSDVLRYCVTRKIAVHSMKKKYKLTFS